MRSLRPFLAAALLLVAAQADARDRIRIVGSSSVLALAQPVAEHFADHWHSPMPSLEVTGTGIGFGLFCRGIGFEHPDMVAASRPMTDAERQTCADNGVTSITEIELGRDAMTLVHANGGPRIDLTRGHLFAALAARVPREGEMVRNPVERWSDVAAHLPDEAILVMAPEPNTSAAIAFQELAMAAGCKEYPGMSTLAEAERVKACRTLRRDDHLVHAPKLERKVIDWLEDNPHGYAVTTFRTYQNFAGQLAANTIEGVEPTVETLAGGDYPLTTGVYLYVKDRHARPIPSIQQFLYELTSERALSPDGYLAEQGLVTLDEIGRNRARDAALQQGM